MIRDSELAEDVCAASAADLWNVLPSILALPPPESFERVKRHFEAALAACAEGWVREPSQN